MSRNIPEPKPLSAAELERMMTLAEAVVGMEDSDGWKAFKHLAEELIRTMTPDIQAFDTNGATIYASQLTFVSGIRRAIGLMEQQKRFLASVKPAPGAD